MQELSDAYKLNVFEVRAVANEEINQFAEALEARLTVAFRVALDTVTEEYNVRLKSLEEDQARILRHLGLED